MTDKNKVKEDMAKRVKQMLTSGTGIDEILTELNMMKRGTQRNPDNQNTFFDKPTPSKTQDFTKIEDLLKAGYMDDILDFLNDLRKKELRKRRSLY